MQARRGIGGIDQSSKQQESVGGGGSPSRESPGTPIEVQTGNSTNVFSTKEEIMSFHHRLQQKARTTAWKLKVRPLEISFFESQKRVEGARS